MKPFCFAQDQVIPSDQASLHPLDIGLIRGYAIFDFFRTENYHPLFLKDYLDRFLTSTEIMRLPLDWHKDELKEIILHLIEVNDLEKGGVRMVLSGGISENNFSPSKGMFFIFCEDLKMPTKEKYEMGIKLLSTEYVRPLPNVKTTNYTLPVWLSIDEWREEKAEDLIYQYREIITESSRSNIFIVKEGQISTPKSNVLYGVTRKKIMGLAEKVLERDILLQELYEADESFITSTTKKILPVTQIDGHLIGDGKPGKVTQLLMQKFRQLELHEITKET